MNKKMKPVHPGEILSEEFLKPFGLSQNRVALDIRVPAPFISSGYRCWTNNLNRGRTSTNHMGKDIDFDFPLQDGEDKRDDSNRCDRFRGILTEKCYFQIGWGANNRKALEPSTIAPTWIHADVRCYNRKFLDDSYFVKSLDELDSKNLLV